MPDLSAAVTGLAASATTLQRVAEAACHVAGHAHDWRARAALHVLDWLGCAAHGAQSPLGLTMARWLALQGEGSCATLAGSRAGAGAAAAFHGALGSTLEMDDVHRSSVVHPGPVVIPAVLAALPPGASGARLLSSVIAGYEAMIRIGRCLGPGHYRWWHTTATAGCFGAAAGAAVAMGLGTQAVAQAMALAGTRAGGLWQVRHEASWGKSWHMGGAAREGVTAAQLAACGMTGPQGILEGPSGWLAATAPGSVERMADESADGSSTVHPRQPWLGDVSFKPWPACRHAHPAMDAWREAVRGRRLAPESIERIDVYGYDDALRFCERRDPQDAPQARFSIAHALAAWAVWGEPQLAHYEGRSLHDPAVVALRQRVHLHADTALQAAYPGHYGARVVVHGRDGSRSQAELRDTFGDPARPMSVADVQAKARALLQAAGWAQGRVESAVAACAALPAVPDLAPWAAVLLGQDLADGLSAP